MKKIISITLVITGFIIGATALSSLAAWTAPGTGYPAGTDCAPPKCNTDAPINASTTAQIKDGPLTLNFKNPTTDNIGLRILGKLKMVDGTEGVGKVLTSDADGVGTWQKPSGSIIALNLHESSSTTTIPANTCSNAIKIETYMDAFRLDGCNGCYVDFTLTDNNTYLDKLSFGSTKGGNNGHYWGYRVWGLSKVIYVTNVNIAHSIKGTLTPNSYIIVDKARYHLTCI